MKLWLEVYDLKGLHYEEVDLMTEDQEIQIIGKKKTRYLNSRHATITFQFDKIRIVGFEKEFGIGAYALRSFELLQNKPKK